MAKKLHLHPQTLNPRQMDQGEGDESNNTTLDVQKSRKSKVFKCFGREMQREREREREREKTTWKRCSMTTKFMPI